MRRIDGAADVEEGLAELARRDARLAAAIALSGEVPLRRRSPGYAALAEIVLSQMVSKASAAALQRRLEAAIGEITPEGFLGLDEAGARAAGLSAAKTGTLRRVAQAVISGDLDLEHLCTLPGEKAIARMTAVKGLGPWTAEVYLLFCAGHPDVFPSGDVALQAAAHRLLDLPARPSSKALAAIAEEWSPWRGVAARLLWAYYAVEMRRSATPVSE
jgi:3-methyladenine DNA glycosylase/8-oxoguanine DNA glycosylase